MHIDKRQTMGVGWNLKIDEGVIGTITLSRLLLLGPSDKFTVIICSRSLYGCASYREVSLFYYCYRLLRSGYCCNRQQQCR